jgi:hypothetical protein
LALPELVVAEDASDVVICTGNLDAAMQAGTQRGNNFLGEVPNVGTFFVQDGCKIVIDPLAGIDEVLLRPIILGPILAILLRQRGLFVLHASSIAVNGTAVAFLGASGCGKSTLATAFYNRGYNIITDDLMPVQVRAGYHYVLPGSPNVRLLPDAAAVLGSAVRDLPYLYLQSGKHIHRTTREFPQTLLPLKYIYVLTIDICHKIEPLQPRDAFVELVRHSRAMGLLKNSHFVTSHFYQSARLVKDVSIRRLQRPLSFAALSDTVTLVEKDLAYA